MFIESIMVLYVGRNEHITDILHWYAESNFDIERMPFNLFDIIDCDYEFSNIDETF